MIIIRHIKPFFYVVGILIAGAVAWTYSDGTNLDDRTGAPGESTCANCHGNLNTGSGSVSIETLGGYKPGDTLDIVVTVRNTGQERWGFGLTSLDAGDQPVGELIITDAVRTRKTIGSNGREYVNHTSQGTDAGTPDSTKWQFKWAAPTSDAGPVTFYTAAVAANNGSGAQGDSTYTTSLTLTASDIRVIGNATLPETFNLSQNHPNPFNAGTIIEFHLPHRSHTEIAVFDILGRRIKVLFEGIRQAGEYSVTWDGTDMTGKPVASGVYFCRLKVEDFAESRKMILMK